MFVFQQVCVEQAGGEGRERNEKRKKAWMQSDSEDGGKGDKIRICYGSKLEIMLFDNFIDLDRKKWFCNDTTEMENTSMELNHLFVPLRTY